MDFIPSTPEAITRYFRIQFLETEIADFERLIKDESAKTYKNANMSVTVGKDSGDIYSTARTYSVGRLNGIRRDNRITAFRNEIAMLTTELEGLKEDQRWAVKAANDIAAENLATEIEVDDNFDPFTWFNEV